MIKNRILKDIQIEKANHSKGRMGVLEKSNSLKPNHIINYIKYKQTKHSN